MKRKRAKSAASRTSRTIQTPPSPATPEKCWYCDTSDAAPGAEAAIVLAKSDDEFSYFATSSDEEEKQILTAVAIPRCFECRTAHKKADSPGWSMLFYILISCVLLGIYFGIFYGKFPVWIYLIIGLAVSGGVIGLAAGIKHHYFLLPENVQPLAAGMFHPEVQKMARSGWAVKI